mmetsp:Transcript_12995/g.31363  ORF Transcript_12995/g.31363 Transcript_12995/m.31363 type:complete len:385 (-) Transcript_12995:154-1308(-)
MELSSFNINNGFAEGIVRGLRSGFLGPEEYRRFAQCDNLEDLRSALDDTDYAGFMQDEPSPIPVSSVEIKARQRLAEDFKYLRGQGVQPLHKFMEFITIDKMIDNVMALLQGTVNGKPPKELLAKVDPLGYFEEMKTIPSMGVDSGYDDIYKTILIDTPVGPYFEEFLRTIGSEEGKSMAEVGTILSETDLELMKNVMKKAWLEDFYSFTQGLGGTTAEVMGHILRMEADFRTMMITLNALNTPLASQANQGERNKLYPSFGYLYPEGTAKLEKAWNEGTVRAALESCGAAKHVQLFDQVKAFYDAESRGKDGANKSIEDLIYVELGYLYELAFEQQMNYAVFYAFVKLKEQEIRNLRWISNMIVMNRKDQADEIVPIFAPRGA